MMSPANSILSVYTCTSPFIEFITNFNGTKLEMPTKHNVNIPPCTYLFSALSSYSLIFFVNRKLYYIHFTYLGILSLMQIFR